MYLAASTYLSSRAFPSTLLSRTPSLLVTPSSYPVLIPGVDSFNHARGQPVTWGISQLSECSNHPNSASSINSSDLCVSLTLNVPASAGAELFNNYGPKSNASFILGYGFALQDNPDDTILLKVGSGPSGREVVDDVKSATSGSGHEIGRNAKGADKLWNDVRELLSTSYRSQEPETSIEEEHQTAKDLQLDMETTDTLSDMVSSLLYRFPSLTKDLGSANVRKEVRMMWEHYVRGQVDILESLLAWLEGKEREAVRRADELGIDVVGEDTDE
ncbi:hypothetical protein EW145_g2486 [Phellinidium pouzarii]|uniref:SET domain-containing protein n=1 Tax=Phellinidium pouzarii TaxID=167371 RepID=A0A4S4LAN6_9AGAM|nr:hypothetical protein EW145_g2486 [Phellinidium pouzarii]